MKSLGFRELFFEQAGQLRASRYCFTSGKAFNTLPVEGIIRKEVKMNPEEAKQIVETIKTLNINFNDATTQKIAEAVIPVVKFYFIYKLSEMVFIITGFAVFMYLTYKVCMRIIETEKEKHAREQKRMEKETAV